MSNKPPRTFQTLCLCILALTTTTSCGSNGNFMKGHWQELTPMPEPREQTVGLMIGDGLLIMGGRTVDDRILDTIIRLQPSAARWESVGRMTRPRANASGVVLHDGSVLLAAGFTSTDEDEESTFVSRKTSERFGPTGVSLASTKMQSEYYLLRTLTTLADGRVLLAGGRDRYQENEPSDVEVYLPATDTWKPTSPLPESRSSHEATLLLDGRVLITGGQDLGNHPMTTTLLYDPVSNQWSDSGSLSEARKGHSATLLPNGSVLVAGGVDDSSNYLRSAELFDSASGRWRNVANMPFARSGHGAAPLPDGRILLIGGATGETWRSSVVLSTTVVYDPKTDTWLDGPSLPAARYGALVLSNEESIYVIGGYDENSQPTDTVFRLNR